MRVYSKSICFLLLYLLGHLFSRAQITLTHNVGDTPVITNMPPCESEESWMRVFNLSDFGVGPNEQFIIHSAQIALSEYNSGATLQYNFFSIDEQYENDVSSAFYHQLIGVAPTGTIAEFKGPPQIIQSNFAKPVVVPAGTKKLLVMVLKYPDTYSTSSSVVTMAGTEEDTGISWYDGCNTNGRTKTTELPNPVPNANFFIKVFGENFNIKATGTTTRLSHNVCDDVSRTTLYSCKDSYIYWSRAFTLSDFGITEDEEFIIKSGQVAVYNTSWQADLNFNIYAIDDDFPASFSEDNLIGSSQYINIPPNIGYIPQIIELQFENPIVVPSSTKRILVEVHKGIVYGSAVAFIGGSSQDNDVSWQRGCTSNKSTINGFATTAELGHPNANFYINVTGEVIHLSHNFGINISNICSEFLKEFSINGTEGISSVVWDFGDPASGVNNESTDLSPFHDFSSDGKYTVTANITTLNGRIEVLKETIDVVEPPLAYGINNLYACEDIANTGVSSTFDLSNIESQVLGGQSNKVVTFIDGSGNQYTSLPSPFTNTIINRETITVRVSHSNNLCCYSETSFDLIVNPKPLLSSVAEFTSCEIDPNGFANFNLNLIESSLIDGQTGISVTFFDVDGNLFPTPLPTSYTNKVPKKKLS